MGEISILKTMSCDNLADLFTKPCHTALFPNVLQILVCVDLEIYRI
jgi:hypothetical protein